MPLCFIEPQDAIRVIAESVGREARRQLVGEVVRAWVDDIPDQELSTHYAKAIADLDEDDLHLLAAWHASLEVGHPIPNTEFLVGVFPSLGENRPIARRGLVTAYDHIDVQRIEFDTAKKPASLLGCQKRASRSDKCIRHKVAALRAITQRVRNHRDRLYRRVQSEQFVSILAERRHATVMLPDVRSIPAETAEFYVVDVRRISSLEHKYELVP